MKRKHICEIKVISKITLQIKSGKIREGSSTEVCFNVFTRDLKEFIDSADPTSSVLNCVVFLMCDNCGVMVVFLSSSQRQISTKEEN